MHKSTHYTEADALDMAAMLRRLGKSPTIAYADGVFTVTA